jgi:cytosine/adenosine deaminase-related metal-dependent hydrolase
MAAVPVTAYAAPTVLPIVAEPVRDGAVLVDGERIVAVTRRADVPSDAHLVELPGILTPGLVNAHAHTEYGPAFADLAAGDRPFPDWIAELTRRRRALTADDWYHQALASADAALATGTTAIADVVTDGAGLAALADRGLAGVSYIEAVGADAARWAARVRAHVEDLLAAAPPTRAVGLSPHTLYTLGGDVVRAVVAMARERGLRLHPHLAETLDEEEYVLAGTGRFAEWNRSFGLVMELMQGGAGHSATRQLDALGGLGDDVHVAHGVHCDAADRALLRQRGTAVALCARSNAILRAGDPPVAAYLGEGNPIAVGTDSLSSTPDLDLLGELRALRALARRQGYARADLDCRLVEAATVGGATAMGLSDIGRLAPGARADLAAFTVDPAEAAADPYAALLAAGPGSCAATVLAGRLVTTAAAGRRE